MKRRAIFLALPAAVLVTLLRLPEAAPQQGFESGQVEQSLRETPNLDAQAAKPAPDIRLEEPKAGAAGGTARFAVQRFVITGNRTIASARLYSLIRGGDGRVDAEMTLSEVRAEADRITRHYRDSGYPLAWAFIPEQKIADGTVEIRVVEGGIGQILVEGNRYYSSEFILGHVEAVQSDETMDLEMLERGLFTLNDYPGLKVGATLRPGAAQGKTDLYLTVEDKFPVSLSVDYDNFGSESVGENRMGATAQVFNLFGVGHYLTLRGVAALNAAEGELAHGRVGYDVPLSSGVRLSAYGSVYDYEAKGEVDVLDPTGKGVVFGASLSYALIRNHSMRLEPGVGFEVKNLDQELLGITTAEDRLRLLVGSLDFQWTDGLAGRWVASGTVRQGLGEVAGGLEDDDPNSSRWGADGKFTRFNLLVYRLQRVISWIHLIGKFHGQYANEPLVVSEQMSLGGADTVRGYPPFEFMGDRGYTATAEARIKIPFLEDVNDPLKDGRTLLDMFQIAGFVDTGEAIREEPAFGERDRQARSAAGVGLRFDYPDIVSVRFDVGWPISDRDPSDDDAPYFWVNVIVNLH